MSRYAITIGDRTFPSKTKALEFYQAILASYEAGEELNDEDFKSVMGLANNGLSIEEIERHETESGHVVQGMMVDFHPDFPSTKCFFFLDQNDLRAPFSYRLAITGSLSHDQIFSRACRHIIAERLREFKMQQFQSRPVRCAVTDQVIEWEECHVDHKAPLTFSVIVRGFIVANNIDTSKIEYAKLGGVV